VDDPSALLIALTAALSLGTSLIPGLVQRLVRKNVHAEPALLPDPVEVEVAYNEALDDLPTHSTGPGEPPAEPTSSGKAEVLAILRVYMRDLVAEANQVARRAGSEQPSKKHVRMAADRIGILRSRAGAVADLALALGAVLVGVGVSYEVNLWTGGVPGQHTGLYAAIAFGAGVGLSVGAGVVKWRDR